MNEATEASADPPDGTVLEMLYAVRGRLARDNPRTSLGLERRVRSVSEQIGDGYTGRQCNGNEFAGEANEHSLGVIA